MKARINHADWIFLNTAGCTSVVELGAGTLIQTQFIHPSVRHKVAIDLHMDYMMASAIDCMRIEGDARDYQNLLPPDFKRDCVMIIDFLEHLDIPDAWRLMNHLLLDFPKVLLMVPEGYHPQTKDVTGFNHHEAQKHRSTWCMETVKRLNPTSIVLDPVFHVAAAGTDNGAIFAVWE